MHWDLRLEIGEVLARHFPNRAPDFVSIDVEGMDLDILRTLDFARWRPPVFCVETSGFGPEINQDILALMDTNAYAVRGGSFVNSVFVDKKRL